MKDDDVSKVTCMVEFEHSKVFKLSTGGLDRNKMKKDMLEELEGMISEDKLNNMDISCYTV